MKISSLFSLFIINPVVYGFTVNDGSVNRNDVNSRVECAAIAGAVLDRVIDPVKESIEDLSVASPRTVPRVAVLFNGDDSAVVTTNLRTVKLNRKVRQIGGHPRAASRKISITSENEAFRKILASEGIKKPSADLLKAVDLNAIPRRAVSIGTQPNKVIASPVPLTPEKEAFRKVLQSAGTKKPSTEVLKAVDLSSVRAVSPGTQPMKVAAFPVLLTPEKEAFRKVLQSAGAKKPSTEVLKPIDLRSVPRRAISPSPALANQMVSTKKSITPRNASSRNAVSVDAKIGTTKTPIFARVLRKAIMPWTKL